MPQLPDGRDAAKSGLHRCLHCAGGTVGRSIAKFASIASATSAAEGMCGLPSSAAPHLGCEWDAKQGQCTCGACALMHVATKPYTTQGGTHLRCCSCILTAATTSAAVMPAAGAAAALRSACNGLLCLSSSWRVCGTTGLVSIGPWL